jgi:hypothetical protein
MPGTSSVNDQTLRTVFSPDAAVAGAGVSDAAVVSVVLVAGVLSDPHAANPTTMIATNNKLKNLFIVFPLSLIHWFM